MNTAFEYCYRDAGNWKQYGTLVFDGDPSDELTARLKRALHDDLWFIADQLRIPALFLRDATPDHHILLARVVAITPTG